jgi:hypothetical protein
LNGCVRPKTLLELAEKKQMDLSGISDNFGKDLQRCFETFTAVHKACDSLEVIQRITAEMIEDFTHENVVYLEIRTVLWLWQSRLRRPTPPKAPQSKTI